MLRTRVITAVILAILLLGGLFFLPASGWRLFSFCIAILAFWEWTRIARFSRPRAQVFLATSVGAGIALCYALSVDDGPASRWAEQVMSAGFAAASLFWIVIVPLWLKWGWRPTNHLLLAATGWVVIFPTWFALMFHRDISPWYLLGLMVIVWVADIAAYFAGHALGRHKLAPGISPGKTWEGVAGAVAGVLAYAALACWVLGRYGEGIAGIALHSWPAIVIAFVALAALSILGDLFESWMKRGAGLKDSSNLLPGHGGVLDRVDALTSTLPVAPFIFLLLGKWLG